MKPMTSDEQAAYALGFQDGFRKITSDEETAVFDAIIRQRDEARRIADGYRSAISAEGWNTFPHPWDGEREP